jgi:hypothetical protein
MTRCFLAFVLAFFCLMASADDSPLKALPPDQEAAALRLAEATGRAIYKHDHAASVATDAAIELPQFKKDKRVRGWITEERESVIVVTFIDATPAALYRIAVSKDGVAGPVTVLETPVPLTAYESGAATARAAAIASEYQPCTENYNSVVLPGADGNKWLVYLLPGTKEDNAVPFGGAYRMEISGSKVISQRVFTRSCITVPNNPDSVIIMVSHFLDPIPTEVHVFWSMWTKKPVYVLIQPLETLWGVGGGKIELIEGKTAERKNESSNE